MENTTVSPFDKLQNGFSPSSGKLDFSKEKVDVSPFHKLQNGVSPTSENINFSKKKQQYHRLIKYKRRFPPLPKVLISHRKTNNMTV